MVFVIAMGGLALANSGNAREANVAGSTEVRDWSAIDTNKDGYVSADEMEAYLKHTGPQSSVSPRQGDDTASIRITEVRNWSAADTNKDNYISPEEMEAYLAQARERARTSTASGQEQNKSQ
jgi:hypothetical protein